MAVALSNLVLFELEQHILGRSLVGYTTSGQKNKLFFFFSWNLENIKDVEKK